MDQDIVELLDLAKLEFSLSSSDESQSPTKWPLESVDIRLIAERLVNQAKINGAQAFSVTNANGERIQLSTNDAAEMIVAMLDSVSKKAPLDVLSYYEKTIAFRKAAITTISLYWSGGLPELAVSLACHLVEQDHYLQNLRSCLSESDLDYSELVSQLLKVLTGSGDFFDSIPRIQLKIIFDFVTQRRFKDLVDATGEDINAIAMHLFRH